MSDIMIELMNFGVPMIYMWLLMVSAVALYFLPTIIAGHRHHSSLFVIALLNIFIGWTMLGWLILLIWAFFGDQHTSWLPPSEKKCPYCAEYIKSDAIKCKHCRSDLTKLDR